MAWGFLLQCPNLEMLDSAFGELGTKMGLVMLMMVELVAAQAEDCHHHPLQLIRDLLCHNIPLAIAAMQEDRCTMAHTAGPMADVQVNKDEDLEADEVAWMYWEDSF